MRYLSAGFQAMLNSGVQTVAYCWMVTRSDAQVVRGTTASRQVTVTTGALAGVYDPSVGMIGSNIRREDGLGVNNLEVTTLVDDTRDINAADIEAGLFDDDAVVLFAVDYTAPDDDQVILLSGNVGEIRRDSEKKAIAEVRGYGQKLQQVVVRTCSVLCPYKLGDTRCTVDLGPHTFTGIVTAVTDRRYFNSSISVGSPYTDITYFDGGEGEWITGDNSGFGFEVRRGSVNSSLGNIELFEKMTKDIQVGDTFSITAGCKHRFTEDCVSKFNNGVNFGGVGLYVPGMNEILKVGRPGAGE